MNVLDKFRLDGKVAVVTGGYGHLGRAISMALKEAEARVFVAGRNKEKFLKVFGEDTNPAFVYMDILKTESIVSAFDSIASGEGKIDILINNAVNLKMGDAFMDDETWNSGVDGVLNSVFRCIREVVKFMRDGSIVNISSMYGFVSPDFRIYDGYEKYTNPPHYGAAKAGVIQLTKYYAVKLAPDIRVNCISPGPFPSPEVQKSKGFMKNLNNKTPLGRIGKPEELKGAVLFLASEASSFVTGHNLVVDGGWTIW